MEVRRARPGEHPAVMTVLESSLLEVDADAVLAGIEAGRTLVAVDGDRVLGALVIDDDVPTDGARIEAVAVRRRRRGQGIGAELVGAARAEHARLVAEFDDGVRPFWASLGFEVQPSTVPGRFVGWVDDRPD